MATHGKGSARWPRVRKGKFFLMAEKVAILLDGGFIKKKLRERLRAFPSTKDVVDLTKDIMRHNALTGCVLFRVYYYDAPPFEGSATNPISGDTIDFSSTQVANKNRALIEALELTPHFAVRRGSLIQPGWKLGSQALRSITAAPRPLTGSDLVPDLQQKGVDIKIGLDIASIALKRAADILVLVTGDSDFVPPMKFARVEGLKVYLEAMGHVVRRELRAHADLVL